jgi:DNA-binding transcriptional LysR family regulator
LELLERTPTGSTPTPQGNLVAEWAIAVLDAVHRLTAGAEALRAQERRQLRVVASYTIAEFLVPAWLTALTRTRPGLVVELEVANSVRVLESLRANCADLGFIESSGDTAGLLARTIGTDELVVVVAPGHPWATRTGPLAAAELAATPLVMREVGSGTRDVLEAALARVGLHVATPVLVLGSTAAVRATVIAGSGPAVLSHLAVEGALATGELVLVPSSGIDLSRRFRAVWAGARTPRGASAALLRVAARERPDPSPPRV